MQDVTVSSQNAVESPTSKPVRGAQFALLGLIFAAVVYAYFFQSAEGQGTGKNPKSVMRWMVGHWEEVSNYSHGPMIPLISAGLILRRSKRFLQLWDVNNPFRVACIATGFLVALGVGWDAAPKEITNLVDAYILTPFGKTKFDFTAWMLFLPLFVSLGFYLAEQTPRPSNRGLWVVGCGVFIYWVGIKSAQTHTVVMSFIILLYGLSLYLWGREASRWLVFPIAFLFLMVPLNFLDRITVPLANVVTVCAAQVCNMVGVEVAYKGTAIWSANRAFQFEIAEACSGIRSLVALGMVTAVYAYLQEPVQWKRWAIFLASLPLAVLGNIARVTTIMLVAQAYGQEVAGGLYHDYSSFIFFPVAMMGMLVFAVLLNLHYAAAWRKLVQPAPSGKPQPSSPPNQESPI